MKIFQKLTSVIAVITITILLVFITSVIEKPAQHNTLQSAVETPLKITIHETDGTKTLAPVVGAKLPSLNEAMSAFYEDRPPGDDRTLEEFKNDYLERASARRQIIAESVRNAPVKGSVRTLDVDSLVTLLGGETVIYGEPDGGFRLKRPVTSRASLRQRAIIVTDSVENAQALDHIDMLITHHETFNYISNQLAIGFKTLEIHFVVNSFLDDFITETSPCFFGNQTCTDQSFNDLIASRDPDKKVTDLFLVTGAFLNSSAESRVARGVASTTSNIAVVKLGSLVRSVFEAALIMHEMFHGHGLTHYVGTDPYNLMVSGWIQGVNMEADQVATVWSKLYAWYPNVKPDNIGGNVLPHNVIGTWTDYFVVYAPIEYRYTICMSSDMQNWTSVPILDENCHPVMSDTTPSVPTYFLDVPGNGSFLEINLSHYRSVYPDYFFRVEAEEIQ